MKNLFYKELKDKGIIFHFVNRRGKRPIRNIVQVDKVFKEK